MRLTTKGRFAVTAMLDLAMHGQAGPVTLAGISERQKISLSYLEQLFGKLVSPSQVFGAAKMIYELTIEYRDELRRSIQRLRSDGYTVVVQ